MTALLPSETDTGFFARAQMEHTSVAQATKADAAEVARAGYDAMMRGADRVFAPLKAKMRAVLAGILPERMITQQARAD